MNAERKILPVVRKFSSFADAEDAQIEYYAGLGWKESAAVVEEMRKLIWSDEYKEARKLVVRKSSLKEDRDDLECFKQNI